MPSVFEKVKSCFVFQRSRGFLPNRKLLSPCLGFFLQGSVKAISICDVIMNIYMIAIHTYGIIFVLPQFDHVNFTTVRPALWTFRYIYFGINIGLSILLYKSASKRNVKLCQIQLIICATTYSGWLILFIVHTFYITFINELILIAYSFFSAYKLYYLWVVFEFVKELKTCSDFNGMLGRLSDDEVQEFLKGHEHIKKSYINDAEAHVDGETYEHKPYKVNFEISLDRLNMDSAMLIGEGQFGTVLKTTLKSESGSEEVQTVAVKTISKNEGVGFFKALLMELKILTHVGQHENIVNLIGACTSKIQDRQVYIIVEFCLYGCLQNYLKVNRGLFFNFIRNGQIVQSKHVINNGYSLACVSDAITTLDLVKWSAQTARGMEYLALKKVVHGDLAARNVLLTHDKTVKIADFGLSRQLYNSKTYVKIEEQLLPYKWLPVESLLDMQFSTKSDVWSYGVTIWEFFSLSTTPYPSHVWSNGFVQQLQDGMRLEQPKYCTVDIYFVMNRCWQEDPALRPTFQELREYFDHILSQHTSHEGDQCPTYSNV